MLQAYIRTPCMQNQIKHVEIKYCSFTRLLNTNIEGTISGFRSRRFEITSIHLTLTSIVFFNKSKFPRGQLNFHSIDKSLPLFGRVIVGLSKFPQNSRAQGRMRPHVQIVSPTVLVAQLVSRYNYCYIYG